MGARRRGSHRSSQKLRERASTEESEAGAAVEKVAGQARGGRASQGIKPSPEEVLAAIESLYVDQLKPFGRILRKRIAERHVKDGAAAASESEAPEAEGGEEPAAKERAGDVFESLPDVDIRHLRAVCDSSELIHVEPEEGGDWSATLVGRDESFVNIYSPTDAYPAQLWNDTVAYLDSLPEAEIHLPGGRYSCAQALVNRKLPFLTNYTLGQVCHIVQLAISQRKLLGYCNGAVVPYSRSQSMVKEQCASSQQPCLTSSAPAEPGVAPNMALPLASWDVARSCLREILENAAVPDQGPSMVPLSNVKRLFRSKYQMELSETALGHSKLSELLQDERFRDVCTVQLQGHGYIVVQTLAPAASAAAPLSVSLATSVTRSPSLSPALSASSDPMRPTLRLADSLGFASQFPGAFLEPYPDASASSSASAAAPAAAATAGSEPRRAMFCPDEPLLLEESLCGEGDASVPLPLHTPLASPGLPTPNTLQRWFSGGAATRAQPLSWSLGLGQAPPLRSLG